MIHPAPSIAKGVASPGAIFYKNAVTIFYSIQSDVSVTESSD